MEKQKQKTRKNGKYFPEVRTARPGIHRPVLRRQPFHCTPGGHSTRLPESDILVGDSQRDSIHCHNLHTLLLRGGGNRARWQAAPERCPGSVTPRKGTG